MTFIANSPAERNSSIIALVLKHLAEAKEPLEYTVLKEIVRDDMSLTDVQVGETITTSIFALISGGFVENSWHDHNRERSVLGTGAMLSLSASAKSLMAQVDGVDEDPDAPFYDSHETDALFDRLGDLSIDVLNFPESGECYLSFSFRPDSEITDDNLRAAKTLVKLFDENPSVRASIIDNELSNGGGFVVSVDCDLGFRSERRAAIKTGETK